MLFAVGGMMLFPAANDLLTMFVALEVLSLPLYLLCGLARRRRLLSQEAALKYFLLGAFSSGFFLYGVALVYGYAGSMEFAAINEAVRNDVGNQGLLLTGMGMLAVGLLFKVGAAPFQAWTPDVYQGAPTPVTAFMAAGTKVAAFGAMLRLFYVAFGSDRWSWQPMLWVVAILTMVVGAVLALSQTDVKRLLAYSSVAHTGFLLTGVLGLQARGELARRPGDLAAGGAVLPGDLRLRHARRVRRGHPGPRLRRRGDRLEPVGGARQGGPDRRRRVRLLPARDGRHPADSGFVGKWAVFAVALSAGAWPVVIVAVLSSIVAAFFYVRVIVLMYFSEPDGPAPVGHPAVDPDRGHGRALHRGDAAARGAAGPAARPRGPCGRIHQVSSLTSPGTPASVLALPVGDDDSRAAAARPDGARRDRAGPARPEPDAVRHRGGLAPARGGRQAVPAAAGPARGRGRPRTPTQQRVLDAACVVELTHIGSLYHDDVMDEAVLRRGADSANARWDNHVAILTGDFLFAKSSELTAGLGPEAVRIQAQTFARLVEGQILETVQPGPGEDPLAHYLDVVAGKTGSLIATSARYGALFAGAAPEVVEALTAYGDIVGTAFQLSDDILDIASDSGESGKTPGTDLREGVPTLPVLMARASTDPADARLHRAARRRPDRRRHPRRGAGPAAQAPGHGRGACLRRGPCRRGQGAARGVAVRAGARGAGGLRRHRRHPLRLVPRMQSDGCALGRPRGVVELDGLRPPPLADIHRRP